MKWSFVYEKKTFDNRCAESLPACTNNVDTNSASSYDAAKVLTEVKITPFFTDEKVADGDVEKTFSRC